jgi:hypothetical protein
VPEASNQIIDDILLRLVHIEMYNRQFVDEHLTGKVLCKQNMCCDVPFWILTIERKCAWRDFASTFRKQPAASK